MSRLLPISEHLSLSAGGKETYLPEEAEKGLAFCWAEAQAVGEDKSTLIVLGCHWACPYEFRS